jgi:selenide,water dikinase
LRQIIEGITVSPQLALLVGNDTADDACVYKLDNQTAVIATADFFTPIVDDPFLFGKIAAANSISDVYAMGGKPIMALGLLGWPVERLEPSLAAQVMHGASTVCSQLGIPLSGGHSIDAPEPFFGLSVNGVVHPSRIKRNNAAGPGDVLFITKPIGTGMLGAAVKRGMDIGAAETAWVETMCKVNSLGADLGKMSFVSAVTDVTGFGLLGHLLEMCDRGRLGAEIQADQVPLLPGVEELAQAMVYTDNTMRNWSAVSSRTEGISGQRLLTLCDPQTNGGLMVAVNAEYALEFSRMLMDMGYGDCAAPIGRFTSPDSPGEGKVVVL